MVASGGSAIGAVKVAEMIIWSWIVEQKRGEKVG